MGKDQIPPRLIKTGGNFLVEPLTDIFNSCFSTSTFPDLAKEPQLHLLTKVVLISIFTQIPNMLVF